MVSLVLFLFKELFIYLILVVLGLHCCMQVFSSFEEQQLTFIGMPWLLIVVDCLTAEHKLKGPMGFNIAARNGEVEVFGDCCCSVSKSHLTHCDPMDCKPSRIPYPWDSLRRNTGVGCHSLLQGNFPMQGSNPGLLHFRQILYCLSHQESPISEGRQTIFLLNFFSFLVHSIPIM